MISGRTGFEGPASVIDAQVQAMSQRVAQNRDRRCTQLRNDASAEAQAILRAARKEARGNVVDAVARERKHGEQALRLAEASARLDERQHAQQQIRALLQQMWTAIAGALESRWADAQRRKAWVQAAVRQGQTLLSSRAWRIEHGAGWSQAELEELKSLAVGDEDVQLVCDNGLGAGIRIRTEGACLDATVAGLLASRARIESEYLACYLALASMSGTA